MSVAVKIAPQLCLNCRAMCDTTAGYDYPHRPMPGSWTICIFCGHLMAFDERMEFRELTQRERSQAEDDRNVRLVRQSIVELNCRKPKGNYA